MKTIQDQLLEVNGTESISSILGVAEDSIFNFSSTLTNDDSGPAAVGDGIAQYVDFLQNNKIDQVGISTGFPVYDKAIGGGLRKSTVNIIAARPKTGKTLLADNMGLYIANKLKIPVLNMDTEMTKEDHIHRLLAMSTEIEISKIETGQFSESPNLVNKIQEATEQLKILLSITK